MPTARHLLVASLSLLAATASAQTHYAWVGTYNPNGEGLYRLPSTVKPARCAIRPWSARCQRGPAHRIA